MNSEESPAVTRASRTPRLWLWVLLPALLAGAIYARMLSATYIWDDAIFQTMQLRYLRSVAATFFPPVGMMEGFNRSYYRPLIPLSALLDETLAGLTGTAMSPAWSHGANLVYHMGVTVFVFFLAYLLLRDAARRAAGAFAAALVFAVHPIHAEAVCSVSGRTDLLVSLFVLASLLIALVGRQRAHGWIFALSSALLFFFALLSKETAVAALILIPAGFWLFPPGREGASRSSRLVYCGLLGALFLASLGVYLKLRAMAGYNYGGSAALDLGEALRKLVSALGYYVRKVALPWPQLHFVVQLPPPLHAAILVTGVGLSTAWIYLKAKRSRPVIAFALVWFGICLAPAFAVVLRSLSQNPVAERYLYLPSVALSLAIAQWFGTADFTGLARRAGALLIGCVTVAYAFSTIERTGVWQDNLRFWTDALRDPAARESPVVQANLAGQLQAIGRSEEARTHLMNAYQRFQAPADRLKVLVNLALFDVSEAQTSYADGALSRAEAQADAAVARLEVVMISELRMAGPPNSTMGIALAIKARVQAQRSNAPDAELLRRAIRHLDIALYSTPVDKAVLEYRALCQRLLSTDTS